MRTACSAALRAALLGSALLAQTFAESRPCLPEPTVTIDGLPVPCQDSGGRLERGVNDTTPVCGTVALPLFDGDRRLEELYGGCYPFAGAAFRRSLVSPGDSRLQLVIRRVQQGKPVTVVTIGGSVAAGSYSGGSGWERASSYQFVHWLQQRYPDSQITHTNIASPGTDSYWRITSFEEVVALSPDLVIYDYSSNDMLQKIGDLEGGLTDLGAIAELIARTVLTEMHHTALLQLVVFRGYASGYAEGTGAEHWKYEKATYDQIARHYNFPLVSYQYMAWPLQDRPTDDLHLFDCGTSVHPLHYIHQFMADAFAYAWVVAEAAADGAQAIPPPDDVPARSLFHRGEISAMASCRTALSHKKAGAFDPVSVGKGWKYWDQRADKEGWQWDAAGAGPLSADTTLGPPLVFEMEFSNETALIANYLRSYQNFGAALVYLDDELDATLALVDVNNRYYALCERATAARKRDPHNTKLDHYLKYARECSRHTAKGGSQPPGVLEAHWDDRSSQTYAHGFVGAYAIVDDKYLRAAAELLGDPAAAADSQYYAQNKEVSIAAPGRHTVTVAPYFPGGFARATAGDGTQFKLMELKSC